MDIPLVADKQLPQGDWPLPIAPQPWHYRQSIDYDITNNRAILDLASRYRETFLYNIYRMGRNSIEKGSRDNWTVTPKRIAALEAAAAAEPRRPARRRRSAGGGDLPLGPRRAAPLPTELYNTVLHDPKLRDPRGYIIPSDQPDFANATEFVNALLKTGITVLKAGAAFSGGRQELPGGFLRGEDRAGFPAARHGHVRAAGPPQRFPLSRRAAQSALRHHRLDAGLADGRAVRPHPGRLRRPVREARRRCCLRRRRRSPDPPARPAT